VDAIFFLHTVPPRAADGVYVCTNRRHLATRPIATTVRQLHYNTNNVARGDEDLFSPLESSYLSPTIVVFYARCNN